VSHAGGADQQQHGGDDGGHQAAFLVPGAGKDRLDGFGAFLAHQPTQFVEQLPLGRFRAIEEAGDGDHEDQDGGEREQRIEGQRRALAGGTVRQPFRHRALEDVEHLARRGYPLSFFFVHRIHTFSPEKEKGYRAHRPTCPRNSVIAKLD
jgi:hypothetical protein